jgi:hypothetical protein
MEMTSPAMLKRRPYWKFSAVRDGRTTSTCAAAHGTILPANHPWWKTHIPPLHFNCRSTIVPLSERRAKELGITKHPPPAPSALGFGNPPDGVPAAAKDMPTEAERKKAEAAAAEVRDKIEAAKAASADATKAKRAVTAAKNERKAAEKALQKANGRQVPPAADRVFKAKRQEEAAIKRAEAKQKEKVRAEQAARKATALGMPRNWEPTEKEVKRRFGKFGDEYIEMMRALKTARPTKKNGRPAFELTTPNGGSIIIQEGDLIREKLEEYIRAKRGEDAEAGAPFWWSKKRHSKASDEKEAKEPTTKTKETADTSKTKTGKTPKKKLNLEKWGHLPKHIRDDVERIANEEGGPDLLPEPESLEEALKKINPNYSESSFEYGHNCPNCAIALAARLRGLDVKATPKKRPQKGEANIAKFPNPFYAYEIEKTPRILKKTADIATKKQKKKAILQEMEKEEDGALFMIFVYGENGGSHMFNAFKENGKIHFIDSQPNDKDCLRYFEEIHDEKPVYFMRVDKIIFSSKKAKPYFSPIDSGGKR